MRRPTYLAALCLCVSLARASLADPPSRAEAAAALRKAAGFFYEHCSKHGGYVWRYSRELKLSEGEAETSPTTIWVLDNVGVLCRFVATSD